MPLYEFHCERCGKSLDVILPIVHNTPACCNKVMKQAITKPSRIKVGPPLWTGRMDDIHKAQEQKGERLRFVHPKEIGASWT